MPVLGVNTVFWRWGLVDRIGRRGRVIGHVIALIFCLALSGLATYGLNQYFGLNDDSPETTGTVGTLRPYDQNQPASEAGSTP
jgi:hypothetical protein